MFRFLEKCIFNSLLTGETFELVINGYATDPLLAIHSVKIIQLLQVRFELVVNWFFYHANFRETTKVILYT
jgi:hypothetical protein